MRRFGAILACAVFVAGCSPAAATPQTVIQQVTVLAPVTVEVTKLVPVTQLVEVTVVVAPTALPTKAATATSNVTAVPTASGPAGVATPQQVGQTIFTVLTLKTAKTISSFLTPKAGNIFIVGDVLIQAIGPDTANYNLFYFKVKDADGFEYHITSAPDPSLNSGTLKGGDKVRGNVAFEVPLTAKGLVMTYDPSIVGANAVEVSLGDVSAIQ